jgi:hypothetical protein
MRLRAVRCGEPDAAGLGSGGIGTERRPQDEPPWFAKAMAQQARCAGVTEDGARIRGGGVISHGTASLR